MTAYSRRGNNFTAKYTVTLWDHFGLDMPNVQKKLGALAEFRAWFVLQHLHGYRPFITKIEFEKEFTGSVSASTVQRPSQ